MLFFCGANGRDWHKADIVAAVIDVHLRGKADIGGLIEDASAPRSDAFELPDARKILRGAAIP